jgi:hypothetical protein
MKFLFKKQQIIMDDDTQEILKRNPSLTINKG